MVDSTLAEYPETGYIGAYAAAPNVGIQAKMFIDIEQNNAYRDPKVIDFCPISELRLEMGKTDITLELEYSDPNIKDFLNHVDAGTWFQIDNEIIVFTEVVNFTVSIKRGCLDTVPAEHAAGSKLLFWDDFSEIHTTEFVSGEEIDVKIISVSGSGLQPLSTAPAIPVTMDSRAARPYPPANLLLDGESFPNEIFNTNSELIVSWNARNRKTQTGDTIIGYFEDSVTAEAGTTYNIYLMQGETEVDSVIGTTNLTVTFVGVATGSYTVVAETVRDGLNNYYQLSHSFTFISTDNGIYVNTAIDSGETFGTADITNV